MSINLGSRNPAAVTLCVTIGLSNQASVTIGTSPPSVKPTSAFKSPVAQYSPKKNLSNIRDNSNRFRLFPGFPSSSSQCRYVPSLTEVSRIPLVACPLAYFITTGSACRRPHEGASALLLKVSEKASRNSLESVHVCVRRKSRLGQTVTRGPSLTCHLF